MRSFIGWVGGKSHLKNQIISLIPGDCERYIEVCGGAGWVLFGKGKIKGQMEVLNDIDGDLINLYKQIKYNCSALQKEVDWLQSRELFSQYRYEIENQVELTDLQRAARYLYLIKCSFGSNRYSFATAPKTIDNIVSSDLARSYNTAVTVARKHGLTPHQTPLLREMDWGIYTGKRLDDVDWTNLPPSVESLDALFQRAIDFIAYLKKNFSGQQIVVIGHGAFNRAIIAYLNGKKAIDMIDLPIMENTSCLRFTLVDDNQTV